MTTATPSSVTFAEKKRLWNEFKYDTFEEISKDKSTMFNYFLLNNDIFRMISKKDEMAFKAVEYAAEQKKATVFFSSIAAIAFADIVLSFAAPRWRIPRYRFAVNFAKYIIAPCTIFTIYVDNFMNEEVIFFYRMQEKYSFGFEDYMKANRIFQRALEVDRLEELREKREKFDWTGIPELPEPKPNK